MDSGLGIKNSRAIYGCLNETTTVRVWLPSLDLCVHSLRDHLGALRHAVIGCPVEGNAHPAMVGVGRGVVAAVTGLDRDLG